MIRNNFTQEEFEAFAPAEKIGLVACINPDGNIHVTLITSIMAANPGQVTLGQFSTGLSKYYMQLNPDVGFLVMSMDKRLWRGKARWTHKQSDGPEYEIYNNLPMFRYNAYFGINTVHYLDLLEISSEGKIPMAKIIPVIQCQAADSRRLVFSSLAFQDELQEVTPETSIGIFGLNLKMQSVFVRGIFRGFKRYRWTNLGVLDIDWVYNSMPPSHGQIYPESRLEPITDF